MPSKNSLLDLLEDYYLITLATLLLCLSSMLKDGCTVAACSPPNYANLCELVILSAYPFLKPYLILGCTW